MTSVSVTYLNSILFVKGKSIQEILSKVSFRLMENHFLGAKSTILVLLLKLYATLNLGVLYVKIQGKFSTKECVFYYGTLLLLYDSIIV